MEVLVLRNCRGKRKRLNSDKITIANYSKLLLERCSIVIEQVWFIEIREFADAIERALFPPGSPFPRLTHVVGGTLTKFAPVRVRSLVVDAPLRPRAFLLGKSRVIARLRTTTVAQNCRESRTPIDLARWSRCATVIGRSRLSAGRETTRNFSRSDAKLRRFRTRRADGKLREYRVWREELGPIFPVFRSRVQVSRLSREYRGNWWIHLRWITCACARVRASDAWNGKTGMAARPRVSKFTPFAFSAINSSFQFVAASRRFSIRCSRIGSRKLVLVWRTFHLALRYRTKWTAR